MSRSKTLDILRAVAIVTVLGRHMEPCPKDVSPIIHAITVTWNRGGWVGVDLFFVLSGFLISGLLFREHQKYGRIELKSFFVRRGLKIYPPFFVLIFVTIAFLLVTKSHIPFRAIIRECLFIQNYNIGLWSHTWSLAVEEHFYILLPIAMIVALRFRILESTPFRWIPPLFVVIAVSCLLLRIHLGLTVPYDDRTHLFPTHLRIDSLFSGVMISYFYHYYAENFKIMATRYKFFVVPLGIACFIPAFLFESKQTPFIYTYGLSMFWIGGCMILFGLVNEEPKTNMLVKSLSFVGSRSYSIYLWHMPVAVWIATPLVGDLGAGNNWYYYILIYLSGSIFLGVLMSYIVEYPILRLRDRVSPSRSSSLSQAETV